MAKLELFYANVVAPRLAKLFAEALREVCGVQAPIKVLPSGHVVATTKATPGAPPRRVSGNLLRKIRVVRNKVYISAPYAMILEHKNHPFLEKAKELMRQRSRSQRTVVRS